MSDPARGCLLFATQPLCQHGDQLVLLLCKGAGGIKANGLGNQKLMLAVIHMHREKRQRLAGGAKVHGGNVQKACDGTGSRRAAPGK